MLSLPGVPEPLPGVIVDIGQTSDERSWIAGTRHTIELVADLPAIRVHTDGQHAGPRRGGAWFAVGDVILTRSDYRAQYALPAGNRFTRQDEWILPAGAVMNVGVASALFPGTTGGGVQVEWLRGARATPKSIDGFWSDQQGNA